MSAILRTRLAGFREAQNVATEGKLGAALVVTNLVKSKRFPIAPNSLLTRGGAQISRLSGNAISRILKSHGVANEVGTEAGRTSRGTPPFAQNYARFLNKLYRDKLLDLDVVEKWWVERFVEHFRTEPFKLKYDHSKALAPVLQSLLDQAVIRQRRTPGKKYVGALVQHLVGAKLELTSPKNSISHFGFEVADKVSRRAGDFVINDCVVHCTTAPNERLIRKCIENIEDRKRPIILTIGQMVGAAENLAETSGVDGKIEIFDVLQFLCAGVYEMSSFKAAQRRIFLERLIHKYNEIVAVCEHDASLRINVILEAARETRRKSARS
jgi:hypothetical protein